VLAVLLAGASFADGKSTRLVASWKNPEYSGPRFHRILVLGMSAKPGVRPTLKMPCRDWWRTTESKPSLATRFGHNKGPSLNCD
jgi:hypothetical protein